MKFPFLAVLLCSTFALQGCAAVLIGSAGVATKSATDARTVGTQVDDGTLELRVANALATNKEIKTTAHINDTAYQGKVLLTGQAPSQALADTAREIAAKTDGTVEVYNEIRIGSNVSLGTSSSDTWITTKIRSQLLASDQVKSSSIKVTTENGEVFLMGLVTAAEGQAAADLASRVNGVKHVTTVYTFLK